MFGKREAEHYDYPILSIYDDVMLPFHYHHIIHNVPLSRRETILYIHIPFCAHHCIFCNYYKSKVFNADLVDKYFVALTKEINYYSKELGQKIVIVGIHFGGGTPSVVPTKYYNLLIEHIKVSFSLINDLTISFEGNINSLTKSNYIKELKKIGINRISFGIQTFKPEIRLQYDLSGNRQKVSKLCSILQNEGISNINADIMFNFPNQSVNEFEEDIYSTFDLGIQSIDLYSLLVYPETNMYQYLIKKGLWKEYSLKNSINKYEKAFIHLAESESYKYTMSNTVSIKDAPENTILKSQLGNNTPDSNNVIGVGTSSRGYIAGIKYKNYVDIHKYIDAIYTYSFGTQLCRRLSSAEQNTKWLVLFPNFMYLNTLMGKVGKRESRLLDQLVTDKILIKENNTYAFVNGKNFWAGNVSALLMDYYETCRMKRTVLMNRKNHYNMYNQDKMQIYEENTDD